MLFYLDLEHQTAICWQMLTDIMEIKTSKHAMYRPLHTFINLFLLDPFSLLLMTFLFSYRHPVKGWFTGWMCTSMKAKNLNTDAFPLMDGYTCGSMMQPWRRSSGPFESQIRLCTQCAWHSSSDTECRGQATTNCSECQSWRILKGCEERNNRLH